MIDARGLACPQPVILVQKAVKQGRPQALEVLVDNNVAVENITRYANNHGYTIAVVAQGADFQLTLTRR